MDAPALEGYIGCVRGLKIGAQLIDLAEINERNIAPSKYEYKSIFTACAKLQQFVASSTTQNSPTISGSGSV